MMRAPRFSKKSFISIIFLLILFFSAAGRGFALTFTEAQANSKKIAGGSTFSVYIDANGILRASGSINGKPLVLPSKRTGYIKVSAGPDYAAAIGSDGTLVFFGNYERLGLSRIISNVMDVACGYDHVLVLKKDKRIYGFGSNSFNQLSVPSSIQGRVVQVAAGAYHSLALTDDGSVFAWGYNAYGLTIVPQSARRGVVQIAAGYYHSLALRSDGFVVCWGLGINEQTQPPPGLKDVVAVAGGYIHSIALTKSGNVVVWGDFIGSPHSDDGFHAGASSQPLSLLQFAENSLYGPNRDVPQNIQGNVKGISAGMNHSLAVTGQGEVVGWGKNDMGQAFGVSEINMQTSSTSSTITTTLTASFMSSFTAQNLQKISLFKVENGLTTLPVSVQVAGSKIVIKTLAGIEEDSVLQLFIGEGALKQNLSGIENPIQAFRLRPGLKFVRIAGKDRYSTAVELSKTHFGSASTVIIATGENFPDALSAAPLASSLNAPILLVKKEMIPQEVLLEIQRLKPANAIIVGGTGSVSEAVRSTLESQGISVERIGGRDRYETSVEVAKKLAQVKGTSVFNRIYVATGENFPDALSAAPVAAVDGFPILLVKRDGVPLPVLRFIRSFGATESLVFGGSGVIFDSVVRQLPNPRRISGLNRYHTSVKVAEFALNNLNMSKKYLYIATGENFPDALASGACAPNYSAPVVLVKKEPPVPNEIKEFLESNSSYLRVFAVGGQGSVSEDVLLTLRSLLE